MSQRSPFHSGHDFASGWQSNQKVSRFRTTSNIYKGQVLIDIGSPIDRDMNNS